MTMTGSIDIVCNLFTSEEVKNNQTGVDETFKGQVRMDPSMREGVSMAEYLLKMDRFRHRAVAAVGGARGRPQRAGLVRDPV